MTLPQSLEELERIAREATPGPWEATHDACAHCGGEWDVYDIPGGAHAKFEREADARYIATFDPPTVIAVLARIRALEEGMTRCVRAADSGHYRDRAELSIAAHPAFDIARALLNQGGEHG